jgi:hypothetical protein
MIWYIHNIARLVGRNIGTAVNARAEKIFLHSTLGTRAIGSTSVPYGEKPNFTLIRITTQKSSFLHCNILPYTEDWTEFNGSKYF